MWWLSGPTTFSSPPRLPLACRVCRGGHDIRIASHHHTGWLILSKYCHPTGLECWGHVSGWPFGSFRSACAPPGFLLQLTSHIKYPGAFIWWLSCLLQIYSATCVYCHICIHPSEFFLFHPCGYADSYRASFKVYLQINVFLFCCASCFYCSHRPFVTHLLKPGIGELTQTGLTWIPVPLPAWEPNLGALTLTPYPFVKVHQFPREWLQLFLSVFTCWSDQKTESSFRSQSRWRGEFHLTKRYTCFFTSQMCRN